MISDLADPHSGQVITEMSMGLNTDSTTGSVEASLMLASYCFNFEGYPAFVVAFVKASTVVFASSNFTTASAFSRFTSALDTPPSLVNDLFTEITHPVQVMPETARVTVLISAYAAVVNKAAAVQHAASNVRSVILNPYISNGATYGKANITTRRTITTPKPIL